MFISSFAISGYRSLKDVEIKDMLPVCVFHGLNNSGKSNILSAIETIFRRKIFLEETTATTESRREGREGSFWRGRIAGFRDNFYLNGKADISFSVSVTFADQELGFMNDVLGAFHHSLGKPGHKKILTLVGKIKYVDDDAADMQLERSVFVNKHVVFEVDKDGRQSLFPAISTLSQEIRLSHFERLMNLLADSFKVLPSDRYLTSEQIVSGSEEAPVLIPKRFKGWLFRLSLSRAGHETYEEIRRMFANEIFEIGQIGFNQEANEIEVMVQEKNIRLPIGRLGSGHQQLLYIIASLVLTKSRMVGIEELEINLSPSAQKVLFEKLKEHVRKSDLASQILITSHSDYFRGRGDVRTYSVEHDGECTIVNDWSQSKGRKFFELFGKDTAKPGKELS